MKGTAALRQLFGTATEKGKKKPTVLNERASRFKSCFALKRTQAQRWDLLAESGAELEISGWLSIESPNSVFCGAENGVLRKASLVPPRAFLVNNPEGIRYSKWG